MLHSLSDVKFSESQYTCKHIQNNQLVISMIEHILASETAFIHSLQKTFKHRDSVLLFFSHFGDAKFIIFCLYPLFFTFNKFLGIYILWLTVFADWLNFLIKWILRSPRPFWWVYITNHYANSVSHVFPHLKHFPITCETGPGNPSGHMMVSTAVYFGILYYVMAFHNSFGTSDKKITIRHRRKARWIIALVILMVIEIGIGLSRMYIAAHFPHQVLFGFMGGFMAWYIASFLYTPRFTTCLWIPATGLALYYVLHYLNLQPDHSVAMAYKFCALRSFVNFNTNPLVSLMRSVGTLFGLSFNDPHYAATSSANTPENSHVNKFNGPLSSNNGTSSKNASRQLTSNNSTHEYSAPTGSKLSYISRFLWRKLLDVDHLAGGHLETAVFTNAALLPKLCQFDLHDSLCSKLLGCPDASLLTLSFNFVPALCLNTLASLAYYSSPSPIFNLLGSANRTSALLLYGFTFLKYSSFTYLVSAIIPKLLLLMSHSWDVRFLKNS